MNRKELEQLTRAELIERAKRVGVSTPEAIDDEELVLAILDRAASPAPLSARTFLERARNLLRSVVDRGLTPGTPEPSRARGTDAGATDARGASPVNTITLAKIYIEQGHRAKALTVLSDILAEDPDHQAARALRDSLQNSPAEPRHVTDAQAANDDEDDSDEGELAEEDLPERYDVDEIVAIAVDPTSVYLYWEVRPASLAAARSPHPQGTLVIRAVSILPQEQGPASETRDLPVDALYGDLYLRDLRPGATLRVSVGWRHGGGFEPIAVGVDLATPRVADGAVQLADAEETQAVAPLARQRVAPLLGADHEGGTPGGATGSQAGPPSISWELLPAEGGSVDGVRVRRRWITRAAGASELTRVPIDSFEGPGGASELVRGGASGVLR